MVSMVMNQLPSEAGPGPVHLLVRAGFVRSRLLREPLGDICECLSPKTNVLEDIVLLLRLWRTSIHLKGDDVFRIKAGLGDT